jgi:hypothetical protein
VCKAFPWVEFSGNQNRNLREIANADIIRVYARTNRETATDTPRTKPLRRLLRAVTSRNNLGRISTDPLKNAFMTTSIENSEFVSRDDVVWCYRNLLGREPESDMVIDWHSRNKSFRALVEQFVRSTEFEAITGAGKTRTQNTLMARTACPDLEAFSRSIDSNMRILRDLYQVCSLEVRPVESSSFCLRDDRGTSINLCLPNDNVIGLFALLNKHWDISKPRFVQQVVACVNDDVLLVDVGANVGLFSRQCLSLIPGIAGLLHMSRTLQTFRCYAEI